MLRLLLLTCLLPSDVLYFLGVYAALSMGTGVFLYVWRLLLSYFGVRAAKRLHTAMFANLLRAPMSFFDQTPLGRIISRFSKDVGPVEPTTRSGCR